jgi:hypothetical protein
MKRKVSTQDPFNRFSHVARIPTTELVRHENPVLFCVRAVPAGLYGAVTTVAVEDKSALSASPTECLTAQRSAALAACLNDNPDIALVAARA